MIFISGCSLFNRTPSSIKTFMTVSEQYKELRYIPNSVAITRLECAYLFALFLPVQMSVDFAEVPLDLRLKLYPKTAYSTVKRDIMSTFPDNTFKPDERIRKYQLAIFITRFIADIDPFFDKGIKEIEIRDVNESFFAYKSINTVVSRNIIELKNGNFDPYAYITGREAINYFHRLSRFYR